MFKKQKQDKPPGPAESPSRANEVAASDDPHRDEDRTLKATTVARRLTRLHEGAAARTDIVQFGMESTYLSALSNIEFEVTDQVGDDQRVATRWVARGNLSGDLHGVAGTGQPVTIKGLTVTSFNRGAMKQEWTYWSFAELDERVAQNTAFRTG
jgi:predicted ester cyclase